MTTVTATTAVLELDGVHKRYGGAIALRGAGLRVGRPGSVHGLIGQNGSGKSTMLGILSGQIKPDEGSIRVGGEAASFASPVDAIKSGIAMVSQETALAFDLSITENILLGHRLRKGPAGIDWAGSHRLAAEILSRLGLSYEPTRKVGSLRPDQRQMVEIARALSLDTRVLILDEPTSSLSEDEVASLFRVIRQLSASGVSTILVTHRLSELFAVCDDLTVLRDGETVAQGPAADFTPDSLVTAMVGRSGATRQVTRTTEPSAGAAPLLELRDVSSGRAVQEVSLTVRPGESVGLVGLVGAGRSELLEVVFGLRPYTGSIVLDGAEVSVRTPRGAMARRIGLIPPDRKKQGVVLNMSVTDNLAMVATHGRGRFRPPRGAAVTASAREVGERVRLKAPNASAPVSALSGGNQQKVALGKWLIDPPALLLLDEPTRGVDVSAKGEIHQILGSLADRGVALLVSSSENDELLNICDRLIVMFNGRIVADIPRDEATETLLSRLAGGHLDH